MEETILLQLKKAKEGGLVLCNLYFTDKRLIVVKGGISGSGAFLLGGVVGYGIAKLQSKGLKKDTTQMSPDEILNFSKKNYAFNYSDVENVRLRKALGVGELTFRLADKKLPRGFTFKKDKIEDVRGVLSKHLKNKLSEE